MIRTTLSPTAVLYPPYDPEEAPVADLDWVTGIVRIFMTRAEWEAVMAADPSTLDADGRYTLEALTHEGTHVLQISHTGYGYDVSWRLFSAVAAAVRDHAALGAIYEHRADYAADIHAAFESLRRTGAGGVTPLAILDSAAFHAQKVSHYEELGPHDYEEMLDEAPDADYRVAYDMAAEQLGADAIDQFPHVASLALFAERPEEAYPLLLEAFRRDASRSNIDANHRMGLAVLTQRCADSLLGTAADRLAAGYVHPILRRIVVTSNRLANSDRLRPVTLFARGRIYDDLLATALVGPTLWVPTPETGGTAPMWVPSHWRDAAATDPLLDPAAMRFFCAAAQLLQQDVERVEPLPSRRPPRSPVASEFNMPFVARALEFSRENRTTETAEHFGRLFARLEAEPAKIRAVRGTTAVTFPDEEFPGDASPLADDEVQAFLREMFTSIPHLLYFLADAPPLAALTLAVAAFAPGSLAFEGDRAGFMPTEEPLKVIAVLQRNAVLFARKQGQEPSAVLGHLAPLPTEARVAIERFAAAT